MSPPPRNVAASVHARLLARSRQRGEDFQFVLQRYGAERFLYRLGESTHRDRFVLKGAMLFALWGGSVYRPTRDLDFTGYGSSETEAVLACFREICALAVEDDGLIFDVATLATEPIRDDAAYDGLRVKFVATLGEARIHMQVDVGFGNVIEPPATDAEYPTLLDGPAPQIHAYPQEAVVAEKLHAMVLLGERNSRFKDFYDLYVLTKEFPFDGRRLAGAIAATFERRRTPIDAARPAALAPRFFSDEARAAQWRSYLDRNRLPGPPADFDAVGELIRAFLGPPWSALVEKAAFGLSWQPGGPWEPKEARLRSATPFSPWRHQAELEPRAARPGGVVVSGAIEARAVMALQRFKPYPQYKDSGVEWLGEIPAHWEVKRLRFAVDLNPTASEVRDITPESEVSFVPMEAVGEYGGLDLTRTKLLADVGAGYTYFRDGDVVVAKITPCFENGKGARALGLTNGIAFGTTELHVLRTTPALDDDFLFYLTLSDAFRRLGEAEMYGAGGQKRVPEAFIENLRHPLPPVPEQRTIATFLDRETAKIDALVAKKERLIELLQEKRTALITQAVTKGLDPNVPMKDSSVEWLGEIPAHWEVRRLKHGADKIGSGKTPSGGAEVYLPEGVMLLRSQNVHFAGLRLDDVAFIDLDTDANMAGSRVQEGDVLLNITGASLGRCCVARLDGRAANVSQHVCVIRPSPGAYEPTFLAAAVASRSVQAQIFNTEDGISRDALNFEQIGELSLARPALEEQRVIVAFLDRETERIGALVAKVRVAIERLKELRTALISAAVTGKIDIREEAA